MVYMTISKREMCAIHLYTYSYIVLFIGHFSNFNNPFYEVPTYR